MQSIGENMSDRVFIFDTTLRDGEQSPGCSMTVPEKLRMARKLVELGVDILEAGFPIASEGDFEAVEAISREFPEARVAGLARCCSAGRGTRRQGARTPRAPRIHTFIATSDIHLKYKLKKIARSRCSKKPWRRWNWRARYADDVEFSAEDGARTERRLPGADFARRGRRPARARSTFPIRWAIRRPRNTAN